jgi:Mn2+/Fe2+ NRAMP family transporter
MHNITPTDIPLSVTDQPKEGVFSAFKKWLFSLGPGIITAALVFGPSKITITSKLGAEFSYALLWIIVVAIFFMAIFTTMSARIGIATEQSLLTIIKQKWGKKASLAIGFSVFLVTASFQAGNSIGIGISLAELTHTPRTPWIIVFNLIAISLLFFRSFYKLLEKIMILLIMLMLVAFLTTLFLVKPAPAEVVTGFVPTIPTGSLGLVIAFVASTFSIVGAFYQAYLVQERKRINPGIPLKQNASLTGIIILGVMSAVVLVCASGVLFSTGVRVTSATDMAKALEPLFGRYASTLFLCGLFGASFSALIGNSTLGGTLLADALGYGNQLNARSTRYLVALVMLIGASIAIAFGKLPLELIVFAQSITILLVPFIGLALYGIANDERVMGQLKNSGTMKVVAGLGLLLIIVLAITNITELIK